MKIFCWKDEKYIFNRHQGMVMKHLDYHMFIQRHKNTNRRNISQVMEESWRVKD